MDSSEMIFVAKVVAATIGSALTFLFGLPDALLVALIAFIILDYMTGVVAAIIAGELSSKKGFKGILRKVMTLVPVVVAHVVDTAIKTGGVLRTAVISFLVANEGISILENTSRCGVPWPPKLKAVLEQLRNKEK